MADVILKPGREKSVLKRHPWIFSGAIQRLAGTAALGESVEIYSYDNQWLARGAYSHNSQIAIRIWTWKVHEDVDESFLYNRLHHAASKRKSLYDIGVSNALRLVHGESDGLPGLIIDQYDDVAVIQYLSAGTEYWSGVINRILPEAIGVNKLYERSDADVRNLEGLPIRVGSVTHNDVPEELVIREHGLQYRINLRSGQKTGFYLDQRQNRFIIRSFVENKDILDCFCYTGGFSLNVWVGNARSIFAIDESAEALAIFKENLQLNQLTTDGISLIKGDVFQLLRGYRDSGRTFDMIILDPPKFAPTTAQVERAARGYKDINLLAMKLLREDGILLTFSCSGGVSQALFGKIIAGAAIDSGNDFQIIGQLHQGADHPIATYFPEGEYLKGLILRRI